MLIYKRKYFPLFALVFSFFLIGSFSLEKSNHDFKLKRAFYQSWVIGEDEKGTDIFLELSKINKGITFDSIIFRGIRLKAFVTPLSRGRVRIKGIIPSGKSRIKLNYQIVNLPDQLIYHRESERKVFFLKNIKRENTKFY